MSSPWTYQAASGPVALSPVSRAPQHASRTRQLGSYPGASNPAVRGPAPPTRTQPPGSYPAARNPAARAPHPQYPSRTQAVGSAPGVRHPAALAPHFPYRTQPAYHHDPYGKPQLAYYQQDAHPAPPQPYQQDPYRAQAPSYAVRVDAKYPQQQHRQRQPEGSGFCDVVNVDHSTRSNLGGPPPSREDSKAQLVAVVLTISDDISYDQLFQTVPQVAGDGKRVNVYTASSRSIRAIMRAFKRGSVELVEGQNSTLDLRQMMKDIASVEADSVVFNWECCSACSYDQFPGEGIQTTQPPLQQASPIQGIYGAVLDMANAYGAGACIQQTTNQAMELMQAVIQRGHMVMCSDFSLKALIGQWSEHLLGPNPFVKLGEFGGRMRLEFDPEALAACPSAQLQKVGELCAEGTAEVNAMSSTIVYGVNRSKAQNAAYKLEVLTVVTAMDYFSLRQEHLCKSGDKVGAAGHILLSYPSGGRLLASAGHWVELANLGVSEDRLVEVATSSYGNAYGNDVRSQLASCGTEEARRHVVQTLASQYVQQSAPCSYSMPQRRAVKQQ